MEGDKDFDDERMKGEKVPNQLDLSGKGRGKRGVEGGGKREGVS